MRRRQILGRPCIAVIELAGAKNWGAKMQSNDNSPNKITLQLERRDDGGLSIWSDDLPGLHLSYKDPFSMALFEDLMLQLKTYWIDPAKLAVDI